MLNRLALLLLLTGSAGAIAADTGEVRAAKFYAAGLERPLAQIRNGARLVQACAGRLRRACTKQQRELARSSRTLELLDALSLFPAPPEDPATGITRAPQLKEKIGETSAALLEQAGNYDAQLLARYGATVRTCPDENAATYRTSLDELVRLDFTGFQALAGDELAQASAALSRAEAATADALRQAPAENCVAARKLGEYLMQLMHSKLQPWSGEDRRVANQDRRFEFGAQGAKPDEAAPTREVAHAVAGNFILVIATELQLTVFPQSGPRIKAIADAVEKANLGQ
jgi:hypothetical protein